MDLLIPESINIGDQLLGQELGAGMAGMSEDMFIFTSRMMQEGLTLPEITDIWGTASEKAMMSGDKVINEAWRVVSELGLIS